MIGYLRGLLRERDAGRLVVDVAGVGYVLQAPASTYLELSPAGEEVQLFVTTHVREDAITLFGFLATDEQRIFELLLSVSGVGPRIALAALSGLGPAELAAAIREGDAGRLATVPGIGRKTAERVVIDLRDKLGPAEAVSAAGGPAAESSARAEVLSALVNLGYPERQAAKALRGVAEELDSGGFDDLLRAALRRLSR